MGAQKRPLKPEESNRAPNVRMDLTLVRHVDHGTDTPDLRIPSNVRFQVRNIVTKEGIANSNEGVILNPNPVMIVPKSREHRRSMNITPKQLKPRCVLEGAKFIGKTKWGPPDLPHPIKKRHCKAFVVNNRVQIFNNNQIRKCTNLTHLVDYDWWGESLSFARSKLHLLGKRTHLWLEPFSSGSPATLLCTKVRGVLEGPFSPPNRLNG